MNNKFSYDSETITIMDIVNLTTAATIVGVVEPLDLEVVGRNENRRSGIALELDPSTGRDDGPDQLALLRAALEPVSRDRQPIFPEHALVAGSTSASGWS